MLSCFEIKLFLPVLWTCDLDHTLIMTYHEHFQPVGQRFEKLLIFLVLVLKVPHLFPCNLTFLC
jgi:hypothetical protein